jgi:hypothetical protein
MACTMRPVEDEGQRHQAAHSNANAEQTASDLTFYRWMPPLGRPIVVLVQPGRDPYCAPVNIWRRKCLQVP